MSQTRMLRKHHKSLNEMANELDRHMGAGPSPSSVQAVILVLSRMSGLLSLHLAMEDKVAYPLLQAQRTYEVVEMARRSFAEVGGLKEEFEAYRRRWMRPAVIQSDWDGYVAETRAVLKSLRQRIVREEGELYRAMESLGL